MDQAAAFKSFKDLCETEGLLGPDLGAEGDDIKSGIHDDGTLHRFLKARKYNVQDALKQYKDTRKWRDANGLIDLYDSIDVDDYEETRKLFTHWTGRTDRNGAPICLFEIAQLNSNVMAAYNKSCSTKTTQPKSTETEAMLRLFCTYENLIRFVLPLCSAIKSRPAPDTPVTDTTCIVDISGVTLMQFWRLRSHLQSASVLATAHYPETLGRTYIIGAPSFFPTIWAWLSRWFDTNTVSKIRIIPSGQECSMLEETIDPSNIPQKYGGQFQFDFGMPPDIDEEIKEMAKWLREEGGQTSREVPLGPVKFMDRGDKLRTAVAVGTIIGTRRCESVFALDQ